MKLKLVEAVNYDNYKEWLDKETYDKLINIDPTRPKYVFAQWILVQYRRMSETDRRLFLMEANWEYLLTLQNNLKNYYKARYNKLFPQDKKSISDFKSFSDFTTFINSIGSIIEDMKLKEIYSQTNVIYKDENCIFASPKTHLASKFFGKNTNWCTAYDSDMNFNNYVGNDPKDPQGILYAYRELNSDGSFKPFEKHPSDGSYDGAGQLYIPISSTHDGECRNGQDDRDAPMLAQEIFDRLPLETNTIIQDIKKKWEGVENTDAEARRAQEAEPYEERFLYSNYDFIRNTLDITAECYIEVRMYSGREDEDPEFETETAKETEGTVELGEDFFRENRRGEEILESLKNDYIELSETNNILTHSMVITYNNSDSMSYITSEIENNTYDDSDENHSYREIKRFIEDNEIYTVITIADHNNYDSFTDEPFAKEMRYYIRETLGHEMYGIESMEGSLAGGAEWVIYTVNKQVTLLSLEDALIKRAENTYTEKDMIRDGQQFMQYEHKKAKQYLSALKE